GGVRRLICKPSKAFLPWGLAVFWYFKKLPVPISVIMNRTRANARCCPTNQFLFVLCRGDRRVALDTHHSFLNARFKWNSSTPIAIAVSPQANQSPKRT